MTLSQALDYVRNRHNAGGDDHWSDAEIYALITARCNEILSVIGMIEDVDTSITTVASTQSYALPSDTVFIKHVTYDGYPCVQIQLKEWEKQKEGNTTSEGRPEYYFLWDSSIYFVPTPDDAKQVVLFVEKEHAMITGDVGFDSIDIPSILHYRLLDGVIGDMFAKDLNAQLASFYENKWQNVHMKAFFQYKMLQKYRGKNPPVADPDSMVSDEGIL